MRTSSFNGRPAPRLSSVRGIARLGLVVGAFCTVISADGMEVVHGEVRRVLVGDDAAFCKVATGRGVLTLRVA